MNKDYDSDYFRERDVLIPHLAQTLNNFAKSSNIISILDIGCGTGRLVKFLNKKGFAATGIDKSEEAIKKAQITNPKKNIQLASATKLPFKKNSFDLVCAISVIEHLSETEARKFLKEAYRILKPEGYLFLVTPNYSTPLRIFQGKNWFAYQDPTHVKYYSPVSLKKLLKNFGFGNFKLLFKINYGPSLQWEFPGISAKLPKNVKKFLASLLYNSPLFIVRNSFWLMSQKIKDPRI